MERMIYMFEKTILKALTRTAENIEAVTNRQTIRSDARDQRLDNARDFINGSVDYSEYHRRNKEIRSEKRNKLLCSYLDGIERRIDRW